MIFHQWMPSAVPKLPLRQRARGLAVGSDCSIGLFILDIRTILEFTPISIIVSFNRLW